MISETKIDSSFRFAQLCLEGYAISFRLHRNAHGDGMLLYIRKYIPSTLIVK